MIFSKRMMLLNIFLLVLSAAVLWVSCDTTTNSNGDGNTTPGLYVNDPAEPETVTFREGNNYDYPGDTLNVDYNGDNNAVFFDFSTGTATELPHDFFDIAIDGDGNIIANSGSYGSGVQVYKTDSTNIAEDFSSLEASVKEYTFKPTLPVERLYGYQSEVNPLGSLGQVGENVCLIKVKYNDTAAYFKVVFSMNMPGANGYSGPPQFVVTVVPGLDAGETGKVELKLSVTGITTSPDSYGWLYFKLVGEGGPRNLNTATALVGGAPAIPKAAEWDILATRTDELQTEDGTTLSTQMSVVNRSSILLNVFKGVKAGVISGHIDDVPASSSVPLRGAVDAIGYGWYSMVGMPPTFPLAGNTYIIKTAEGKFAKFQPETFYSPQNYPFVMDFAYYYEAGE